MGKDGIYYHHRQTLGELLDAYLRSVSKIQVYGPCMKQIEIIADCDSFKYVNGTSNHHYTEEVFQKTLIDNRTRRGKAVICLREIDRGIPEALRLST